MARSKILFRLVSTIGFMVIITALSVVPGQSQPGDSVFVWVVALTPAMLQKSMHVVMYAALAALWVWTLSAVRPNVVWQVTLALIIVIVFGASLEACQLFVPGRFGSLFDVFLNSIGAIAGVFGARRGMQLHGTDS